MTPTYLAKTVRVLDERTDAVLCNSVVQYIDQNGAPIGLYNTGLALADSQSAAARFGWMVLRSHSCVDFFGLIRRETLQDSLLHGSFHGADRALLAQLAVRRPITRAARGDAGASESLHALERAFRRSGCVARRFEAREDQSPDVAAVCRVPEDGTQGADAGERARRLLLRAREVVVRELEHRARGGGPDRCCCAWSADRRGKSEDQVVWGRARASPGGSEAMSFRSQ